MEKDLEAFLTPIFELAQSCPDVPFQIFFDELNTTCAMGLKKSIICDRLFAGKFVPSNV
jgi:hypothetical protein